MAMGMRAIERLATIHAHSADVVVQRLAYYVSKSDTSLPEFAVWSLIAQTVDFVVHIDLVRNESDDAGAPTRRVTSIIEVGGLGERGGLATTEVWGIGADGRWSRSYEWVVVDPEGYTIVVSRKKADA